MFGHYLLIFVASTMSGLILFVTSINRTRPRLSVTLLDLIVVALITYMVISAALVSEFPVRYIVYRDIACCFVFYILCSHTFRYNKNSLTLFSYAAAIIATLLCINSLIRLTSIVPSQSQAFNITYPFENPGILAIFMACALPFGIHLITTKNNKARVIGYVCVTLILLVLFYSKARASWIAAIFGVLYMINHRYNLLSRLNDILKRRVKIAIVFTIVIFIIGLCYGLYRMKPDSVKGRLLIYGVTIGQIAKNPIFGSGYDTFPRTYNLAQANHFENNVTSQSQQMLASNNTVAFNDYFQFTAETGIMGFMLLALAFLVLYRDRNKFTKPEDVAVFSSLTIWVINSCFSYPFHSTPTLILLLILLSGVNSRLRYREISLNKSTLFVSACAMAAIAYFTAMELVYIKKWSELTSSTTPKSSTIQKDKYASLYKNLNANPFFLYNYGVTLTSSEYYSEAIEIMNETSRYFMDSDVLCCLGKAYQGEKRYDDAFRCFSIAHNMVPNKFYPLYCELLLYEEANDFEKANIVADDILSKLTKVPSPEIDFIKSEAERIKLNIMD